MYCQHRIGFLCNQLMPVYLQKYVDAYEGETLIAIRETVVPCEPETVCCGQLKYRRCLLVSDEIPGACNC